ncbi:hypothetical protein SAMN05519103_08817 [Rhizobiales bacterium GAS113]|nr:hypothetical protein SAMN05519103_08817 [Rhizobiales bacterium GAS113]
MDHTTGLRSSRRNAPDEALDEALRRGSFSALLAGLLFAIAFPAALWLSDFVPEHAGPAWESIERGAVLVTKDVAMYLGAAFARDAGPALDLRSATAPR